MDDLGDDAEWGGQEMPKMLTVLSDEMLFATNPSFMLYPLLSVGAGMALNSYGSQEQKETYLPKIYSGEWSGTMCLTEPHAGTDLGIIKTKAERNGDGTYSITGTKFDVFLIRFFEACWSRYNTVVPGTAFAVTHLV
jgi:alkylation response protein AidB-like acyl-CoA dehydrogenase